MWRNEETKEFVQWMKERNDNIPLGDKTELGLGIYGMDVRTVASQSPCPSQATCRKRRSVHAW